MNPADAAAIRTLKEFKNLELTSELVFFFVFVFISERNKTSSPQMNFNGSDGGGGGGAKLSRTAP